MNLGLPDDLHAQAVADADDRSLSSWLVAVVRRAVSRVAAPDRPAIRPTLIGAFAKACKLSPKALQLDTYAGVLDETRTSQVTRS